MSDELLWYAARISGLMTWMLACGSIIAGIIARSSRRGSTGNAGSAPSSRLWAVDAYRFLGVASVGFLAVHAASLVANPLFDLEPESIVGRDGGQWLETGLLLGVLAAWLLIVVEALRLIESRRPAAVSAVTTALAAAVVVAGGYHGWSAGTDVQHPLSLVVVAVFALGVVAAASLAYGDGPDRNSAAETADRTPEEPAGLGQERVKIEKPPTPTPTPSPTSAPTPTSTPPPTSAPTPTPPVDRSTPFRPGIVLPELQRSREVAPNTPPPVPIIDSARFVDPPEDVVDG